MKTLTKVQKYILFALGFWFEQAKKKIKDRSLDLSISKVSFIDIMIKAKLAKKKERALYKNLESLEKMKLISYDNKNLSLTKKGKEAFKKIHTEIKPYINISNLLFKKDPLKFANKIQTVFK